MELMKFEGWVEKVLAGNEYQQEIIVRDYESVDTKEKFSNEITFTASVKSGAAEQLKDVRPDDKVRIQFKKWAVSSNVRAEAAEAKEKEKK